MKNDHEVTVYFKRTGSYGRGFSLDRLLDVLREQLGYVGTKKAAERESAEPVR